MDRDDSFNDHLHELESLLAEMELIRDEAVRDRLARIIQGLLEFHGAAVARMLECLGESGEPGKAALDGMASDELVGSLLLLHGLHPLDLETRVGQALEKTRPYLKSHGGDVELLAIGEDGRVMLRLVGSCHGCPSSQATMKGAIEEAIYAAAPDVAGIDVEGLAEEPAPASDTALPPVAPAGFVPLAQVGIRRGSAVAG